MHYGSQLSGQRWSELAELIASEVRGSFTHRRVYGSVELTADRRLDEWTLPGGGVVTLSYRIGFDLVEVTTTTEDPLGVVARSQTAVDPRILNPRRPTAMSAQVFEPQGVIVLDVDGDSVEFSYWKLAEHSWAVARIRGDGVVVHSVGRALGSIELEAVSDIGPYIEGLFLHWDSGTRWRG